MDNSDNNPEHSRIIGIGSKVKITLPDNGEKTFTIGSTKEADPSQGIISNECPLGKALIGAKQGENISYIVGESTFTVRVSEAT